ncbi:MAG TPA: hypothetical protein VF099_03380 [Ktedonobacterales bacterium]
MREMMHKGATVEVRLYIEGEDEPAHDFAQLATQIARQVVDLGIDAYKKNGALQVTLTSAKVLEGSDGEEQAEG